MLPLRTATSAFRQCSKFLIRSSTFALQASLRLRRPQKSKADFLVLGITGSLPLDFRFSLPKKQRERNITCLQMYHTHHMTVNPTEKIIGKVTVF